MNRRGAITILRWGLAFVFFYAAVASLLRPQDWTGLLPRFIGDVLPLRLVLTVFSIYEIALAVLLFIGRKLRLASILSLVTLAAVVIFNLGALDSVFKDVGLAMASLALFELVRKQPLDKNNDLV